MSAPITTISNVAGTPGPTANAAAAATGFEDLLAGLFAQAAPGAAQAGLPVGSAQAGVTEETPEDAAAETAPVDPNLTLAADAALLAAQVPQPQAQEPATPDGEATAAQASGRGKRGPAAPAFRHADAHARLEDKFQSAQDLEAGEVAEDAAALQPHPGKAEPPAHAPANGLRGAAPAAPTVPSAAQPAQAPAADVDAQAAVPAETAQQSATATETPAATAAAAATTGRAPVDAPAAPAPKSERARSQDGKSESAPEAASPASPRAAAAGPKPAVGAKPAEQASAEAVAASDGAPRDADADAADETAGQPDAVAAQDVDGPAHSTPASMAPTAHAVRGSPETVAHLAAQIVKKLDAQSTRFDLELNPHGLGRVDVRLEIGANGQLTAAMNFDNPQAAAELRARANELSRALEQAGFDLSGGLSFNVAGDPGQQAGRGWQGSDDTAPGFRGQAFQAALAAAGEADQAAAMGALRLRRGVTAGLDLRI